MARFLVVSTFLILVFSVSDAMARTPFTSDVNHQGWYDSGKGTAISRYKPVNWKPMNTGCIPCQALVQDYNFAMREVFGLRASVKQIQEGIRERGEYYNELHGSEPTGEGKDIDTSKPNVREGQELGAAALRMSEILARGEVEQKDQIQYEAKLQAAENRAQQLREAIADCEKQCKGKINTTDIEIGGQPKIIGSDPKKSPPLFKYKSPKWWKGPFDSVCWKCEKLAIELNKRIPYEIEWRQREIASLERLNDSFLLDVDEQVRMSDLKSHMHRLEEHYNKTLKIYNDCIKTCKGKKTACTYPEDSTKLISIGPNSEVGTGAALTDKIESKAKGAAMGALGSMLGGSGVSLGGGGKGKEPKMDKDPTSGPFQDLVSKHPGVEHMAGVEAGGRFVMVDDELVASVKLDDVPGDGTFHAMWIEDGQGNIIFPSRYLLIDLYRDWKLSVWWDYKRWRDNELVEHRSGDSMTVGTDYLGTLALFEGAKGIAKSIWNQLGFGTAVKGAKHIGAVFPGHIASGPCPLKLVTHVSLPKEDPVVTQGLTMNIDVGADEGGKDVQYEPPASDLKQSAPSKKSKNEGAREGESKGAKRVRERAKSHNE